MKVLLTLDLHNFKEEYTFIVYDLDKNLVINKIPFQKELLCLKVKEEQGKHPWRPFGITSSTNYIFIANHSKIGVFDKKTYKFLGIICNDGVINTHQILYYQDHIFRTNTSSDSISKIRLKDNFQTHFCFKQNKQISNIIIPNHYKNIDNYHVNSLTIVNNHLYTISSNLGIRPSTLNKLDLDLTLKTDEVDDIGVCSHSLLNYYNSFITLSSCTEEIIQINMDSKNTQVLFPIKEDYFLRGGIIKNDDIYFIGNSKTTNHPIPATLYKYNMTSKILTQVILKDIGIINDMHLID